MEREGDGAVVVVAGNTGNGAAPSQFILLSDSEAPLMCGAGSPCRCQQSIQFSSPPPLAGEGAEKPFDQAN
jgi:hypothetical protein